MWTTRCGCYRNSLVLEKEAGGINGALSSELGKCVWLSTMGDRNEYHGYSESLYRIPLDLFPSSHLGLCFASLVMRRISFFVFAVRKSETDRADVCCTTKSADAHFMDVLCSCTKLVAESSTGIENRNGGRHDRQSREKRSRSPVQRAQTVTRHLRPAL